MIQMLLELICAIPENVGWMLVGAAGAYASVMGWKVGKLIYIAIKERLGNGEEECEE